MNVRPGISAEEALQHTEWVGRLARALAAIDAEDLAQDAWEAALESDEAPKSELRAWLTGVMRNLSAMGARGRARRERREAASVVPEPSLAPDELLERLQLQQLVAKLVSELDEPVRLVLFLRYYEGLSAAEIGERLQIPAGTVRWRLKTGVDALRERLDQSFNGERSKWMSLLLPTLALASAGKGGVLPGVMWMKANKVVLGVLSAVVLAVLGAWWWWPNAQAASAEAQGAAARQVAAAGASGLRAGGPADTAPTLVPKWMSQPDAPVRRVAGRVISSGQPVANAVVRLESQTQNEGVRELRTTATGTFDFGVQLPLRYTVGASAPGLTGRVAEIDLRDPSASPAPEALELVLTGCDAKVMGRVLDAASLPIERAWLRVRGGVGAESNAKGEYELCLPLGDHQLRVGANGYGTVKIAVLALGRVQRDVVLAPEAFISGRVVADASGAPIADAVVRGVPVQFMKEGPMGNGVLSGPDGRFRLPVSPGSYKVGASFANSMTSSDVQVSAVVGQPGSDVVLRLKEGTTLRGRVMEAGKPVAGAQVQVIWANGGQELDAFSQDDGRFVLHGVRKGEVAFFASPFEVVSPKRMKIVKEDETVELEVKPQGSLQGVITREQKPVPFAQIDVIPGTTMAITAYADANGKYVVRGLAAGKYEVVASSSVVGGFIDKEVVLAPQENRQLDLELSNAATIEGKVVAADGTPVPSAMVVFTHTTMGDEGRGVTDADGHFRCMQMTGGGDYLPRVFPSVSSRTPYKPATGTSFAPTRLADGSSRVENVTLTINYERLRISGRVIDKEGAPVADVHLRAQPAQPGELPDFASWLMAPSTVSDGQGNFTFEGLTSGNWAIQARGADGAESTVTDLQAGAKNVTITLKAPSGIEGTLVDFEEPPVVYAAVSHQSRFVGGQVTGNTFRVTVPQGKYVLSAMNAAEGDVKLVEVKEGQWTKVTMTSHGRGVVTGTVIDHRTRAPLNDFVCHVVAAGDGMAGITNWDERSSPRTDEQGYFVADPAPAGSIQVACMGDWREFSSGTALATVPRGGKVNVAMEAVRRTRPLQSAGDIGLIFMDTLDAEIATVRPGTPAAKAGLMPGEFVVAVDGEPTTALDSNGVQVLIGNHEPGSKVVLTVLRGNQRRDVTVSVVMSIP